MSIDWTADVLAFHAKFCPEQIGAAPAIRSELIELRLRLIHEELDEFKIALLKDDVPESADAIADLIYVTIGTAIAFGIDLRPVWDAVQAANMSKVGGSRRGDGKVLKGPNFVPPDIAGVLAKQKGFEVPEGSGESTT